MIKDLQNKIDFISNNILQYFFTFKKHLIEVFLYQPKASIVSIETILTIHLIEKPLLPFPLYLNCYLKLFLTLILLATLIKGIQLRCLILSFVTWKESNGKPINYLICKDQINALCWAFFIIARIAFMISPIPVR